MAEARTISDLTNVDSPAWPEIESRVQASSLTCEIITADVEARRNALVDLQVTIASPLGAIAWSCGAILIDHRWVRVLGAGVGQLPPAHVQHFANSGTGNVFEGVAAAYDALGGVFAIHGAGLDVQPGEICYWAPETLEWSPLGFGHSSLVEFMLSDQLPSFYESVRWEGWESECDALEPDQGIFSYPMPFTKEGRAPHPISRSAAPILEVVDVGFDFAKQLSSKTEVD